MIFLLTWFKSYANLKAIEYTKYFWITHLFYGKIIAFWGIKLLQGRIRIKLLSSLLSNRIHNNFIIILGLDEECKESPISLREKNLLEKEKEIERLENMVKEAVRKAEEVFYKTYLK